MFVHSGAPYMSDLSAFAADEGGKTEKRKRNSSPINIEGKYMYN